MQIFPHIVNLQLQNNSKIHILTYSLLQGVKKKVDFIKHSLFSCIFKINFRLINLITMKHLALTLPIIYIFFILSCQPEESSDPAQSNEDDTQATIDTTQTPSDTIVSVIDTTQPNATDTLILPTVVSDETMQAIYNEVKTPNKYGLVLISGQKEIQYDCPTVFKHNGKYYMTYIVYDKTIARGYETCLAESEDLLNWNTLGTILSFSDDSDWDSNQKAGYLSLINYEWGGDNAIEKYNDKYWLSYFGGTSEGYESGDLSIGIAYTEQEANIAHEWQRYDSPVLSSSDADVRWFETVKLYKSSIIKDKENVTGHSFIMYYNASDGNAERIGMAVSDDMINWERYGDEPLISRDSGICGDPVIQKIDDVYVMFFFGLAWPDRDDPAVFNRFACSYDLANWTEWDGDNLIEPTDTTGSYDKTFAHKPYVIKENGIVYHFYCAVDKKGSRGIALATSIDLGESDIDFVY